MKFPTVLRSMEMILSTATATALMVSLTACEAADAPAAEQPSAAPLLATQLSARDVLRSRIDLTSSKLALGVDASQLPQQHALDIDQFTQALTAITGSELDAQFQTETLTYLKMGEKTVALDPALRYVNVHDARGYEHAEQKALTDAELMAVSDDVLAGMGIDANEATSEVVGLGAQSGSPEGKVTEVSRVGQKVFYFRKLGGIPVAGNRMVFSFGMDGSLRHIRGTWPALELTHSYTRSALSTEQVVERAIDAMLAEGIRTDSPNPIRLETFFEWDEDEAKATGSASVRLRAAALTQAMGPEGRPGRGVRYEFDI